jgi:hypothetical protein
MTSSYASAVDFSNNINYLKDTPRVGYFIFTIKMGMVGDGISIS